MAVALLAAGCAGNDLAARPDPPPGAGTWVAVWLAAGLATLVLAALLTWPLWLRRSGSRLATAVLGVQAAALWILAALAVASAVRTRQLSARDPDELPVEALLELGRIGDPAFPGQLVLAAATFVGLPALLLTLAARFAASDHRPERIAAAVVLALQVGMWVALLARGLLVADAGRTSWVAAANLPVSALAAARCWPPPTGAPVLPTRAPRTASG